MEMGKGNISKNIMTLAGEKKRVPFTQNFSGIPLWGDVPVTVLKCSVPYHRTQNNY